MSDHGALELSVYIHINDGETICIPFTTAGQYSHR